MEPTGPNRREFVGGVGAGIVTAMGSSAMAQQAGAATASAQAAAVQNPATAYPRPPFERQQQESSGLANQMRPPPDHGEKSYRGAGRVAGRKALITGGDSGMGRAAAIAFAMGEVYGAVGGRGGPGR